MERKIMATAAALGMLAIMFGAFGAHSLKPLLTPEQLSTFETGVKYQMYHALMLLFVGQSPQLQGKAKNGIFWLVVIGVLFFSGSVYLLSLNHLLPFDFRTFGFITPIGGLLLILAWIWLCVNFISQRR